MWLHQCQEQVWAPLELELRKQVQGLSGVCWFLQFLKGAMFAVDYSHCCWGCWRLGKKTRSQWLELVRGYSLRSKEQRVNNKGLSWTRKVSGSILFLLIDHLLCARHSSGRQKKTV